MLSSSNTFRLTGLPGQIESVRMSLSLSLSLSLCVCVCVCHLLACTARGNARFVECTSYVHLSMRVWFLPHGISRGHTGGVKLTFLFLLFPPACFPHLFQRREKGSSVSCPRQHYSRWWYLITNRSLFQLLGSMRENLPVVVSFEYQRQGLPDVQAHASKSLAPG